MSKYIIYKICCDDLPDYNYVGSTKAFRQRKKNHKERSLTEKSKLYVTIRENGGWDKWNMQPLEECDESIDTFIKAKIREEEWRVKLNANLNMNVCFSSEEHKKNKKLEADIRYRKNNKEIISERQKIYIKENPERYRECKRNYDIKNKIKIEEIRSQKVICDCGCEVRKDCLTRHKKSNKHLNLLNI